MNEPLRQSVRSRTPIGEVLVKHGIVTSEVVEEALREQQAAGGRIGDILLNQGAVSEAQLVRVLAEQFGIRFVDLEDQLPDEEAGRAIKEHFARRLRAVGIAWERGALVVAMANPTDVFALDDIRTLVGCDIVPVMAVGSHVDKLIDRIYRKGGEAEAELLRRLPSARVEHVEGAGHSIQGDKPVELAALLADFV